MYFENNSTNRESWKFSYKGKDLAPQAIALYQEFKNKEMDARNKMSELIKDPNISHGDERIRQCKTEIETNGKQAEACFIWAYEFKRVPDREYFLSLGDVIYFRII